MGTKNFSNATDLITFSRASGGTCLDSDGLLKTASTNIPRIDYNPDGTVKGLLIEEARTNILLSSDDLSNASYWSPLSGASTPVAASPIMGASAWTLSGAGHLRQSGLALAASTAHTVWFRMRLPSSPDVGKLRIRVYDNNSSTFITLANGSTVSDFVYDTSGVVTRDTSAVDFLVDEGNGVYLVGAAFTTLATMTTHLVYINCDVSNNTQSVEVGTPQLEAGSFPTSYIPTSGATATRAADIASIPVTDFGYNQDAGTVVIEWQAIGGLDDPTAQYLLGTSNGSSRWAYHNSAGALQTWDGASAKTIVSLAQNNTPYKSAISSTLAVVSTATNATAYISDSATNGNLVRLTDEFRFGVDHLNSNYLNGHIKSIQYYPRHLTNTQLQELTS